MKFPNSFAAWAKTTSRHNAFIDAIIQSKVHIITTARCKTEYIMVDRNGKKFPKKSEWHQLHAMALSLKCWLALN
jgi:hypothetical protein